MNVIEARSATKRLVEISGSLAGLDTSPQCTESFVDVVSQVFEERHYEGMLEQGRRPEAVGNLLKWVAATLMVAQEKGVAEISENHVNDGRDRVCPVYPFGRRRS